MTEVQTVHDLQRALVSRGRSTTSVVRLPQGRTRTNEGYILRQDPITGRCSVSYWERGGETPATWFEDEAAAVRHLAKSLLGDERLSARVFEGDPGDVGLQASAPVDSRPEGTRVCAPRAPVDPVHPTNWRGVLAALVIVVMGALMLARAGVWLLTPFR